MLRLGQFEVDETHAVEVDAARCEVRVELTDPRTGEAVAVEGVKACLIGADGSPASAEGTTDRDGEVSLVITNPESGAVLQLDLRGRTLFDFEAQELMAEGDVEPVESRPLMRLPEVWRSDGQSALHDDLWGTVVDGRLPILDPGAGTVETPWVVRVDHAWTGIDVVFEFYDTQEFGLSSVEQGLMLEAFDGTSFSEHTRVGGGTVAGDGGVHFLRLFREVAPESLHLRVVAPVGTFLQLTDRSSPLQRWGTLATGTVTPLGERLERYDMPELWCSRGQYASVDGGATARVFSEIAGELLEGGRTVHFHPDDVLLVDDKFRPVRIASAIPVTVFGGDFVVKRPDAREPQHSDVTIERAHLRGREAYHFDMTDAGGAPRLHAMTRVIRRGRRFYDLDGTRTTEGEVVGVRRAVRDAHPKIGVLSKGVKGGFRHQVEFHLFGGVGILDVDGVPHSAQVALVYASVRLLPFLGSNPSDADLKAVRQGFADAAERWTCEPLSIPQAEGTPVGRQIYLVEEERTRATKFVFHFPTIEKGVGTIGAFLVTKRKNFRAHAAVGELTLKIPEDCEPTRQEREDDTVGDVVVHRRLEDNVEVTGLVVAHELGHIMGLPDEYSEDNAVDLPQFLQRLRVLLHTAQAESIMNGGFAPMLRHQWVLAQALGDNGLVDKNTHVFCDTRRLDSVRGRPHRYRNPLASSPYVELSTFELGPKHGRHKGLVCALGDDFDVYPGVSDVDGVVVLSPRLYVRFLGEDDDTEENSDGAHRREFHEAIVDAMEKTGGSVATPPVLRRTSGGDGSRLPRRLVVSLQPRFSRVNIAAADLRVRVRRATRQAGHAPFSARRNRVDIHVDQEATLVRHLLGLATERAPTLLMSEGGAKLVFAVGSLTATFTESLSESVGIDEYVSKIPNPAGGFIRLDGAEVAVNLASAINDSANSLHGHVSATADGLRVTLEVAGDQVLDVRVTGSLIEFLPRFRNSIEHSELASLAEAVGEALGETFEVEP